MSLVPLDELFADIGGQPNSCTHEEYYAFAKRVRETPRGRLLVFGVGRDSIAWQGVNRGGTTLFLENNPEWISKIAAVVGEERIREISYPQTFEDWNDLGLGLDQVQLPENVTDLLDASWNHVFVDAPWGPTFGRHQSTLAATKAVRPGGLLALHDCEREREQTICRILLEGQGFELLEEVERLRIYRAP